MKARPTIAVLGTLTLDTTTYADGTSTENLGGLVYSLATLQSLFDGTARILPVANVGVDLEARVRAALALPGIDQGALRRVPQPNNHVHLRYRDGAERDEILVGLVPPIDTEHALAARDAEWVLVNLTSGRDLELEVLQALRNAARGFLQLDIHSLTLGFLPGGKRVLEKPARWRDWVACADWVQMNETEAMLLAEGATLESLAATVLASGPSGVAVTLGERGCWAKWRDGTTLRTLALPPAHTPDTPYPTGCGDVFGASFAWARLAGADVESALRSANGIAGTKAGIEAQAALRDLRRLAARHLVHSSSPRSRANTE